MLDPRELPARDRILGRRPRSRPHPLLGLDVDPSPGYNVSRGAADPSLDEDLATLATVTDQEQSLVAAGRVVDEMEQDAPAVFLYAPAESLVVDSKSLSNLVVPAAGDPFARRPSGRADPAGPRRA